VNAIQLQVEALLSDFRLESGALQLLLKGPVVQDLVKRALRVEAAAKGFATGQGGGPQVRTGRLRGSITWRVGVDSASPYVDVGTAVEYGIFVELGHRNSAHAYPIYTPGGRFSGRFGYVTDRPTRPYPYLRPALQAARTT
jgi:Bacteriophage HK97-gp10, putative tail-component